MQGYSLYSQTWMKVCHDLQQYKGDFDILFTKLQIDQWQDKHIATLDLNGTWNIGILEFFPISIVCSLEVCANIFLNSYISYGWEICWWVTNFFWGGYLLDIIPIYGVIRKICPSPKKENIVRVSVFNQLVCMMVSISCVTHLVQMSRDLPKYYTFSVT